MKDMSYILQHVTDKSLIVIDELGRSRCSLSFLFIIVASCRHSDRRRDRRVFRHLRRTHPFVCTVFLLSLSAFSVTQLLQALVFFATHFLDLAMLDANYACVEKSILIGRCSDCSPIFPFSFHFGPQVVRTHEEDGAVLETLEPNHKLGKGPYRGPLYGTLRFLRSYRCTHTSQK
jgi:hypothetical protein